MARWTTCETVLNPKNSFDSTFTVFWKKNSHCRGLKWSEQSLWKARAPYVHKQSKTFIDFNEILASFPRLKYGFVFYRGQGRLHDCTNSYSWVLSFPKDLFYRTNFANTYDANSKVRCSCKLPWVCNLHTPCCHIFKMIDNQTESIQCVGNENVKKQLPSQLKWLLPTQPNQRSIAGTVGKINSKKQKKEWCNSALLEKLKINQALSRTCQSRKITSVCVICRLKSKRGISQKLTIHTG